MKAFECCLTALLFKYYAPKFNIGSNTVRKLTLYSPSSLSSVN